MSAVDEILSDHLRGQLIGIDVIPRVTLIILAALILKK